MKETGMNETNQYLSFMLDDEIFALEISGVREVLEFTRVTRVPKTPGFMRGVINLRGRVVPVVDLKFKFGMGQSAVTIDTCIIIAEIAMDDEITVLGAMADSVHEVIRLEPREIEPAPRLGTHLDIKFIKGMGKKDDALIIILDIKNLFSIRELSAVKEPGDIPASPLNDLPGKENEEEKPGVNPREVVT
jgi:purine-binding chemotaxis protein CheW